MRDGFIIVRFNNADKIIGTQHSILCDDLAPKLRNLSVDFFEAFGVAMVCRPSGVRVLNKIYVGIRLLLSEGGVGHPCGLGHATIPSVPCARARVV